MLVHLTVNGTDAVTFSHAICKPAIAGIWRGQSSCEQKESACRDERRLPGLAASGPARLILGERGQDCRWQGRQHGTLEFRYIAAQRALVCEYAQGIWRLSVDGTKPEGTLIRPDGIVFRRVALRKE
jgi:hypothetical protein